MFAGQIILGLATTFLWNETKKLLFEQNCFKVLYLQSKAAELPTFLEGGNITYYNMRSFGVLDSFDFNCSIINRINLEEVKAEFTSIGYRSQYLNIFVGYSNSDILDVFKLAWKFYLVNVVLLTEDLDLFTYHPLDETTCQNILPFRFLKNTRLEPKKQMYFPNCTLRISNVPIKPFTFGRNGDGLEDRVLGELLRVLQLVPQYVVWNDNLLQSDAKINDLVNQKLHSHEVDIDVSGQTYLPDKVHIFDKTYPHAVSNMAFFVPVASLRAPWKSLVLIFQYDVWVAILASFTLTTLVYYFTGESNVLVMFNVMFSSVPRQPKIWRLRLVFVFWTYTVLVLLSCYQSLLVAFLFKKSLDKQVSTVDEIVASGLEFGGTPVAKSLFLLETNSTYLYIRENYLPCSRHDLGCYKRVVYNKNFALFIRERIIFYRLKLNETNQVYMIAPSHLLYCVFYMPKGSPFTQRMNEVIVLMWDVGLMDKWDEYGKKKDVREEEQMHKAITLGHLGLIFGAYLFGIATSLIVFAWEYYENCNLLQ